MEALLGYLESFYERTQPLQQLQRVYKPLEGFQADFEGGSVPGWEDRGEGRSVSEAEGQIDLDAFDTVEELLTIGNPPPIITCEICIPNAASHPMIDSLCAGECIETVIVSVMATALFSSFNFSSSNIQRRT